MKTILDNIDKCTGCTACKNVCPKSAIKMKENSEGFLYPVIDKDICVDCGLCTKVCPINNETKIKFNQKFYAMWTQDNKIRLNSSSGGIFTEIAKYILTSNGIVYGASFDENYNLKHTSINKISDLHKLTGSKYLQSDLNDVFKEIKNLLKDTKVLFVGTPCQVIGLKKYLKCDFSNLYTCDLICHGVPSPLVFKNYLETYTDISKIKNINFRDKIIGWKNFSFTLDLKNKEKITEIFSNNLYMRGFLNNLYLRKSCYDCKFANLNRYSDITLGDFWNYEAILNKKEDDKGISLVIVNSDKGNEIINQIKNNVVIEEVTKEDALKTNACLQKGVAYNKKRELFFEKYNDNNKDLKFIIKYVNISFIDKVKNKIVFVVRRVIK